MRSIYKYDITESTTGLVSGPITKVLCTDVQKGRIVIWAEVDTDAPERFFQFFPIGTGWNLSNVGEDNDCILDTHTYIGTIQLMGGSLIYHIYGAEVVKVGKKTKFKKLNMASAAAEPQVEPEKPMIKAEKKASFSGVAMLNPELFSKLI